MFDAGLRRQVRCAGENSWRIPAVFTPVVEDCLGRGSSAVQLRIPFLHTL